MSVIQNIPKFSAMQRIAVHQEIVRQETGNAQVTDSSPAVGSILVGSIANFVNRNRQPRTEYSSRMIWPRFIIHT